MNVWQQFALWYVVCGALIALILALPGAVVDRESNRPVRITLKAWVIFAALWPICFSIVVVNGWRPRR